MPIPLLLAIAFAAGVVVALALVSARRSADDVVNRGRATTAMTCVPKCATATFSWVTIPTASHLDLDAELDDTLGR